MQRRTAHDGPVPTDDARQRSPRLAAGRARALGVPTRGTTHPNRLRRIDRWIVGTQAGLLTDATDPLVVDLGYGASAVTTVELAERLRSVRRDLRVVGLEIAPDRVIAAQPYADPPSLDFRRGGFELAGLRPVLIRAMNVLRQYDEPAAARAWQTMTERLAPAGLLVEGTCDELGRVCTWVAVGAGGPRTLTLSAKPSMLQRPGVLAERLPKTLIHHNVPGQAVHELLGALDDAWDRSAAQSPFGGRARWTAMAHRLATDGWPVVGGSARWRLGELTVRWDAVG